MELLVYKLRSTRKIKIIRTWKRRTIESIKKYSGRNSYEKKKIKSIDKENQNKFMSRRTTTPQSTFNFVKLTNSIKLIKLIIWIKFQYCNSYLVIILRSKWFLISETSQRKTNSRCKTSVHIVWSWFHEFNLRDLVFHLI